MISKPKKHIITLLELPLILVFMALKIIVAILTVIYIRSIRKGIIMGKSLHTKIEHHEIGYKKGKK